MKLIRDIFNQRLASLTSRQESKITALVEEYLSDLHEVQRTALRYSQGEGAEGPRALSIIAQLGETAVATLDATVTAQKPGPDTSLLMNMANGVAFAESAVVKRLKAALTDTRRVPQPPEMRTVEEVGPPHRVCDEAYIRLRRILNLESYLQQLMESRHFLGLPDATKNKEIESWKHTGIFTRFLGDVDTQEK